MWSRLIELLLLCARLIQLKTSEILSMLHIVATDTDANNACMYHTGIDNYWQFSNYVNNRGFMCWIIMSSLSKKQLVKWTHAKPRKNSSRNCWFPLIFIIVSEICQASGTCTANGISLSLFSHFSPRLDPNLREFLPSCCLLLLIRPTKIGLINHHYFGGFRFNIMNKM